MKFFEKDLEEIIYLSDKDKLSDRGLYLNGKLKRQLRIGNYGVADLIEYKRPYYHPYEKCFMKGTINILELKKDKIGVSTFFQALNYLKGIQTYLEENSKEFDYNYKITLIGSEFDTSSSFCYLGDMFNNDLDEQYIFTTSKISIDIYTYSYGLEGIEFTQVTGYNLKNKGF